MQVHLHGDNKFAIGAPCNGARGKHRFKSTAAKDTRVGWRAPQKEMNGGSDAKRRAALAESREMAEE